MSKLEDTTLSKSISNRVQDQRLRIVGHPHAAIGMGEFCRSLWRSVKEVGLDASLVDVYGPFGPVDPEITALIGDDGVSDLGDGINIFVMNGDEVDPIFKHLKNRNLNSPGSYNIIYPAWELERYPSEWAKELSRFDEVWGLSKFTTDALARAVTKPTRHMSLASEVRQKSLLSRKHFGIRESAYTFFFAFDFLSYIERKNPLAVISAFSEMLRKHPYADVSLVIKTNNADRKPEMKAQFDAAIEPIRQRVTLIDGTLDGPDMKSLIWLNDCFVSLHRSEGYGFGIAEAMSLGKPVIATEYSGNMDFCDHETAILIPYTLKSLSRGDYPHWEGQKWAQADISMAAAAMSRLVDSPQWGRELGRRAQIHMQTNFSYLARGLKVMEAVEQIQKRILDTTKTGA
ncbi:glycosyltransferase family 4 protein [Asticcacaulis sp. BYS171W]|uniref:Glycosyltransferase family 4 protein n=1 Tax=Asticcacaulis aquaticus TaxID=2984212 RepID=A0ABT5HS14_9CAUL|nr:glycosyltransferase family 4 protein [Asticcacaulis aquaticus]MDC7682862.1 glycosyltransferase family 4 protein [Asticcacaulis aquaticus]